MVLLAAGGINDSRYHLALVPVHEFRWWIYICLIALHTIVSVIIMELMGRTYKKYWLWLLVAFCFPVVGAIAIFIYHTIASTGMREARRRSFWERILQSGPVSLLRALQKEQSRAQEVKLHVYVQGNGKPKSNGHDAEIEALLSQGRFRDARGHAWKMIEIAREAGHGDQITKYLDYLEVIALKESAATGIDFT
jgi:hypothetical protein